MANNKIARGSAEWIGCATNAAAITADGSTITPTRGLMVNVAGNVSVKFADASAYITLTLSAGAVYPFSIVSVQASGTTATGLTGLY